MNPGIYQEISTIVLAPHTLLAPTTQEVVTDAASGDVWIDRTPRQVSRRGVDGSTSRDIHNAFSAVETTYPVLIGIFTTSPPCGINTIHKVANKWQSASPGLVRQIQKLDVIVDGNFPNDQDSASTFSKLIGHKLSNGSRGNLYTRCRMNFAADPVQT